MKVASMSFELKKWELILLPLPLLLLLLLIYIQYIIIIIVVVIFQNVGRDKNNFIPRTFLQMLITPPLVGFAI